MSTITPAALAAIAAYIDALTASGACDPGEYTTAEIHAMLVADLEMGDPGTVGRHTEWLS